jgi:hypothetical protein
LHLFRVSLVARPDACFQDGEPFHLAPHEVAALDLLAAAQRPVERGVRVARATQAESTRDRGEGATLLTQAEDLLVEVASWSWARRYRAATGAPVA